jgi:hypothetical protein
MGELMDVTIYLVGVDAEDALTSFYFDSYESALSASLDQPQTKVFEIDGWIDPVSIRESEDR